MNSAKAKLKSGVAIRETLKRQISHMVTAAWSRKCEAEERRKNAETAYRACRSWALAVLDGYEMGTVSTKELTDGIRAYVMSRFEFVEAIHAYNVAVAKLSQASGRELQKELAGLSFNTQNRHRL